MGAFRNCSTQCLSTLVSVTMALTTPSHTVGLLPLYAQHNSELTLRLRDKRRGPLLVDSFNVTNNDTEEVMFQLKGKKWSPSHHREVHDSQGNQLFFIAKKLASIPSNFEIRDLTFDEPILTIKSNFHPKIGLTAKYQNPTTNREETVKLQGNWFSRAAEVTLETGEIVARIARVYEGAGQFFLSRQYTITIAPNVDAALMMMLCVCFDEVAFDG